MAGYYSTVVRIWLLAAAAAALAALRRGPVFCYHGNVRAFPTLSKNASPPPLRKMGI